MSDKRDPYDGLPYYCKLCGVGLAEFNACEEGDCELESPDDAAKRRELKLLGNPQMYNKNA